MKISATQSVIKRKSILQTGIHLIQKNGPTVGIQEVANKAKIPKGSFYNYFSSKDQFLIEALEEYTQNAILWNNQTLEKGKRKLSYLYEQKVILEKKFLKDGISCLINVLSQCSSPKEQKLRNKLKLSLDSISKGILDSLRLDPKNYSKEISIHIQVLESSWRGAMLLAKATGDPSYLENFLSVHRKLIKEFL